MTMPQTLLDRLAVTPDPHRRATLLEELAVDEEAAARHAAARLARIVADSERLLVDPDAEPADPAWDDETWWPLAGLTDRAQRARVLESLCRNWAQPRFGDEAAVLLHIADTERDMSGIPPDTPIHSSQADQPALTVPPAPPSETWRDSALAALHNLTARSAGRIVFGLVFAALVVVVALGPSLSARFASASMLTLLMVGWIAHACLYGNRP